MAEEQFFVGERVIAEQKQFFPGCPAQVIVGKITKVYKWPKGDSYDLKGDDGKTYRLSLGRRSRGFNVEAMPDDLSDESPEFIDLDYHLKRFHPEELREDFPSVLEQQLSLIRQLAREGNETQRAAVLATARNLTRYLSSEIDAAYKEAERLAKESDETGRAAALATLRNLNDYLRARQGSKER